ncbi:tRNA uridine 5-carboxymethylaminomethyl modification enzyme [Thermotomaculum hydrothermale]|uniref:tRNA uridine 5-carboxymethylaminomethyl modification enzyme MnmG n=1 Tax=Thermotomaculum hydrothermale TaxID=981385 RepID=A0A7R6SZB7_9BACT|nr:tRNA uridine-5-carboxymethylaminomethyl(34) synthesis enzyme MnmG [Thermotomaculum hydrothermale]BBB33481.1 tRNA uridine 5-carboxymethylaminomethyl modification enzyme [Thermotomaculum hydrothermale]
MIYFDVVVIGAGHAGCEAGYATAKMGFKTCLLTINLDVVGQMSCNPAIGGLAKGHIVREIDALGGLMAKIIDKTGIQFRMLNKSRGPAVQAPRAQADKVMYRLEMRKALEETENLYLIQDIAERIVVKNGEVSEVILESGNVISCKKLIVSTGTFLGGKIFIGDKTYPAGRTNEIPSTTLADSLKDLGFELIRFKTGTPARVHRDSIDFSKMERQDGDEPPPFFSFNPPKRKVEQIPCYLTYTNEKTHEIIFKNIHRSSLFSGLIQGIGPRYCPSIEDKLKKFPDRERHQVFLEPESRYTVEYYVNGVSTSLPVEVQYEYLRTIKGLENVEILRPGYAIEYFSINPLSLKVSLESKEIKGLYFAGQINGTSGYEEAAGQGLIAGINAALALKDREPVVLGRDQAYIGVMIDDLVTKGVDEPYRMFTSRSEYRLLLDHYTADKRLMPIGHSVGLIDDETYNRMLEKYEKIEKYLREVVSLPVKKALNGDFFTHFSSIDKSKVHTLEKLLKRPEISFEMIAPYLREGYLTEYETEVETAVKYKGYIEREMRRVEKSKDLEKVKIPEDFNYNISGLSREVREKLEKVRPVNLAQASRIPGVTPASISILYLTLTKKRK